MVRPADDACRLEEYLHIWVKLRAFTLLALESLGEVKPMLEERAASETVSG